MLHICVFISFTFLFDLKFFCFFFILLPDIYAPIATYAEVLTVYFSLETCAITFAFEFLVPFLTGNRIN